MTTPSFSVRVFYSYSHKDDQYRGKMEESLALLKRDGYLIQWSDKNILPGQSISATIADNMKKADIVVFLISSSFLASDECMKEWKRAKTMHVGSRRPHRVPIIVGRCAWKDLLADDDIKVLPDDGKPIKTFNDPDEAWAQVYGGMKSLVEDLRADSSPRTRFLKQLQDVGDVVVSQRPSTLDDLFVFLPLSVYEPGSTERYDLPETTITNIDSLLQRGHVLVHGDDQSGKTALGRHIVLSLINREQSVLFVDLQVVKATSDIDIILAKTYHDQFRGDYIKWRNHQSITIVLDNLSSEPASIEFLTSVLKRYDNVIALASTSTYVSYYRDDTRLAKCTILQISPLTHVLQEELIRKRLRLMNANTMHDGAVDQVERRVNAIVNTRILPRYPFYVLSILQTLEAFMPRDMTITSHGHCYYIFIVARLMNAGIPKGDEAINVCVNFAERLAFSIYSHNAVNQQSFSRSDFDLFVANYKKQYVLPDYIRQRLIRRNYGILTDDGKFQHPYMYYFFLGRYLAIHEHADIIDDMCQNSHISENHLTLLFIIHHATNDEIIDDIMIRTMCSLDDIPPARLSPEETKQFRSIVAGLPTDILSGRSVEDERRASRHARDHDDRDNDVTDGDHSFNRMIYQILKNNELLGQILKARYGTFTKQKIAEIIETIADSGLRLVNLLLSDENDISETARYLHARTPKVSEQRIKWLLQFMSFLWTMINVELVVNAVSHRETAPIIRDLIRRRDNPAYDVIGFFCALDSANELTPELRRDLKMLLKRHDDSFVRSVLSIRVQHYMNTHRSSAKIEQGVCADLGIRYRHRIVPPS